MTTTPKVFGNSKLVKLTMLGINCEKLKSPSNGSELKVYIRMGVELNEKKTELGYEVTYNLDVKCKKDEEERLMSLDYRARAIYEIGYDKNDIKSVFNYFLRELYMSTREYLNDTLYRMKVRFNLPPQPARGG